MGLDDGDTDCNLYDENNLQRLGKVTGRLRNHRYSGDYLDDNIIKIGHNTEKSP